MTAIPQHMVALSYANRIRTARAKLKQQIAEGERTAASVIYGCPDEAATMTVLDVLTAQWQWGARRARTALIVAQIAESKTVGALTDRQRKVLVDLLEWGT